MNPTKIDSTPSRERREAIVRARLSSELEGGRSSAEARAVQERWVDGQLTYEEFGAAITALHPASRTR
jgi:hypothetical protein